MEAFQNTKNCLLISTLRTRDLVGEYFLKGIEEGFVKLGYNCIVIETKEVDYELNKVVDLVFQTFLKYEIEFIFMNCVSWFTLKYKGKCFWSYFKYPVVQFMVDAPAHFSEAITFKVDNAILTYVDKDHVKLVKEHLDRKQTFFVPHGANKSDINECKPWEQREIDVLFAGNFLDPSSIYENIKIHGDTYVNTIDMIVQCMLDDEACNYGDVVFNIVDPRNLNSQTKIHLLSSYYIADYIYRNIVRKKVLYEIVTSGINVTCYGYGWEQTDLVKHCNFKYKGSANYDVILNEMNNSKVVLNIIPSFKNGGHERIFSTMLNQSVCVTNYNKYLGEQFRDGEDIVFYKFSNLEELPVKINNILNSKQDFNRIISNAKEIAETKHTWVNRAQDILDIVKLYYKDK